MNGGSTKRGLSWTLTCGRVGRERAGVEMKSKGMLLLNMERKGREICDVTIGT